MSRMVQFTATDVGHAPQDTWTHTICETKTVKLEDCSENNHSTWQRPGNEIERALRRGSEDHVMEEVLLVLKSFLHGCHQARRSGDHIQY